MYILFCRWQKKLKGQGSTLVFQQWWSSLMQHIRFNFCYYELLYYLMGWRTLLSTFAHEVCDLLFAFWCFQWEKHPRKIIEPFILLLAPYAPHMSEELWFRLGHSNSLAYESFPKVKFCLLVLYLTFLCSQIDGAVTKMIGGNWMSLNSGYPENETIHNTDFSFIC